MWYIHLQTQRASMSSMASLLADTDMPDQEKQNCQYSVYLIRETIIDQTDNTEVWCGGQFALVNRRDRATSPV